MPKFKSALLGIALFTVAAALHAAPRTLTFGTSEGSTAGRTAKDLAGVMAHLNSGPDLKFVLKTYPTYDAAYDALKKGEVELVLVGAVKYVQAHSEIGAIPVVAEAPKWQESVIIVPKDSPIKTVPELKGKKFAFGYDDSTSTYLLPMLLFSKYQMTQKDVKAEFLGADQSKILAAVAAGQFDAGAVASIVYENNADKVRALERSEKIPSGTVVARKDIAPALLAKVREQFVSYKPAGEQQHLRFARGAEAATNEDYNKVRFLCKVVLKKTYN